MRLSILAAALSVFSLSQSHSSAAEPELSRIRHAKELLGKHYSRSVVKTAEEISDISVFIYASAASRMTGKWEKFNLPVAEAILNASEDYGFDPVFLVALIQHESRFRPDIVGSSGEIGLMQIRPSTAQWLAKKMGIHWKGRKSLFDPVTNIKYGAYFISLLRDHFSMHSRLYLAAYNMGTYRVKQFLSSDVWPKEYPIKVMQEYVACYQKIRDDLDEFAEQKERKESRIAAIVP